MDGDENVKAWINWRRAAARALARRASCGGALEGQQRFAAWRTAAATAYGRNSIALSASLIICAFTLSHGWRIMASGALNIIMKYSGAYGVNGVENGGCVGEHQRCGGMASKAKSKIESSSNNGQKLNRGRMA